MSSVPAHREARAAGWSVLSPRYVNTERGTMRDTTSQLCLRAAKQQAGVSPATAVAIGSGGAALGG